MKPTNANVHATNSLELPKANLTPSKKNSKKYRLTHVHCKLVLTLAISFTGKCVHPLFTSFASRSITIYMILRATFDVMF